jgi:hypothetical protein
MQNTGTAGPEIVIERDVGEQGLHVGGAVDGHTAVPDLAETVAVVGVPAHEGGHVEGDRESAAAASEDHLVTLVGLHRVAEPGELTDGPGPPAVARRVQAPGEGVLPRPSDPLEALPLLVRRRLRYAVQPGSVDRLAGVTGKSREVGLAHATGGERGVVALLPAGRAAVGSGRIWAHVIEFTRTS